MKDLPALKRDEERPLTDEEAEAFVPGVVASWRSAGGGPSDKFHLVDARPRGSKRGTFLAVDAFASRGDWFYLDATKVPPSGEVPDYAWYDAEAFARGQC